MLPNRPTRSIRTHRRGVLTIELALVLPVFLLLVVAMIGFADLLIAEQKMDQASNQAARVAALGGSEQQIEDAVLAVLGPDRAKHARVQITPIDLDDQPGAVSPESPKVEPDDDADDEQPPTSTQAPARHLGLIEVRVEIEVRYVTATRFVPISRTEKLIGRTVVQRQ